MLVGAWRVTFWGSLAMAITAGVGRSSVRSSDALIKPALNDAWPKKDDHPGLRQRQNLSRPQRVVAVADDANELLGGEGAIQDWI